MSTLEMVESLSLYPGNLRGNSPQTPPPRNKAISLAFLGPHFLGGWHWGENPLGSHDIKVDMIFVGRNMLRISPYIQTGLCYLQVKIDGTDAKW